MESLSPEFRQIVELRFFDGLTAQEIGTALAIKPATVRKRQQRALDALRQRMAQRARPAMVMFCACQLLAQRQAAEALMAWRRCRRHRGVVASWRYDRPRWDDSCHERYHERQRVRGIGQSCFPEWHLSQQCQLHLFAACICCDGGSGSWSRPDLRLSLSSEAHQPVVLSDNAQYVAPPRVRSEPDNADKRTEPAAFAADQASEPEPSEFAAVQPAEKQINNDRIIELAQLVERHRKYCRLADVMIRFDANQMPKLMRPSE